MSIPDFDHNGVLPAHQGDPTEPGQLSPYPATAREVVERFGTTPPRRAILCGWLELRADLRTAGLSGFQWLNGSFAQDIERQEDRAPQDMDVVSFVRTASVGLPPSVSPPAWLFPDASKERYRVDHYLVNLSGPGEAVVEATRYWSGLFSHTRDGIWKGMLRIDLDTPDMDAEAVVLLAEASP
ncbi:hypothetical protein RM530_16385 [Algiphilus sp. W345]|uniref:Uncharacterized protein n=1 Tax=Banduia mediterranea TaxID=3075609 RepID=A0ABU2WNV2_9GAMM|nr:hypothetical protein [Algiphilus sp. W345]MDT0498924.1 hypothetical protein [Algiphilus sp. W345]